MRAYFGVERVEAARDEPGGTVGVLAGAAPGDEPGQP